MDFAIEILNLTKTYSSTNKAEEKIALQNLSLQVPRGKIFGLLGPNGAGKSTLINILSNTVNKTSGSVKIMGIDIDSMPKAARTQIGVVPQEITLDTFFPLHQGLEFIAGYYGKTVTKEQINQLLRDLGLFDKRNVIPMQLSGGMKRRFMIAKSMIHEPPVLILDEPTAGVDLELRNQLWDYVVKLNKKGVTIIITTHYLAEAQTLCDEIAFINHGKIVLQDKTKNLLDKIGTRCLDLFLNDDYDLEILEKKTEYKFVQVAPQHIRFPIVDNNLPQLIAQIHKNQIPIKDIKIIEPDLEDVFSKVVS